MFNPDTEYSIIQFLGANESTHPFVYLVLTNESVPKRHFFEEGERTTVCGMDFVPDYDFVHMAYYDTKEDKVMTAYLPIHNKVIKPNIISKEDFEVLRLTGFSLSKEAFYTKLDSAIICTECVQKTLETHNTTDAYDQFIQTRVGALIIKNPAD